ncbi:guanine-1-methyltransferase-domain-containing protein [Roridomyces roridus]|uniref:tRNA (guanine(9)-N1)-methyltransferase n=1 Tax=Roridomyces roridus TaxID=1738132 RepID=A0AAD7FUD0_9AGAR|nr:guanine-1-methyltransferase-domain-containing protein [Roridomyces roridus]
MDADVEADNVEVDTVEVEAPAAAEDAQPTQPSKKSLKKAAKRERFQAQKLERRAREKVAKKEKQRIRAEKRAAGELDEEDLPKKKKPRVGPPFGGRVVVDLGFDEKMTEKEVHSLCSQLAYTYSANRNAGHQFSLLFTGLDGKTLARMDSMSDAGYKRWANSEFWTEGYERLWSEDPTVKPTIVYLTADSDEELTELKPEETYIIGGICDHNRLKRRPTVSALPVLPIGTYLSDLKTRKVLTVNQTFEILVHWVDTRDWESAFHTVIPKRKFEENSKEKAAVPEGTAVVSVEEVEEQTEA